MRPVQTALQAGLFQENSLLYKDVAAHADRRAGCAIRRSGGAAPRLPAPHQHRAGRRGTRQSVRLRDAQRRDLIRLLAEEIKPPQKAAPPPYDYSYTLYMVGRLPEDKLKSLFDPGNGPQ